MDATNLDRVAIIVTTLSDRDQANLDAQTAIPGCGPANFNQGQAFSVGAVDHVYTIWVCNATDFAALHTAFSTPPRSFFDGSLYTLNQALTSLGLTQYVAPLPI